MPKVVDSTGYEKTTALPNVNSLSEVGAALTDYIAIGDTSDGGNAKKTLVSSVLGLGDWALLATATASADATVDFTGLSSTYAAYMVIYAHVAPATDAVLLNLRTSTDGGATYDAGASDYSWVSFVTSTAPATGQIVDGADAQITIGANSLGNAANETNSGCVWLFNLSSANYGTVYYESSGRDSLGRLVGVYGTGQRLSAANVDAIRFMFSSGDITSGEFRLYGLINT